MANAFKTILLIGFIGLLMSFEISGQESNPKRPGLVIKPVATLVDQFGLNNSEVRSSRFDAFFSEISKNPGSVGYVFFYCGKTCKLGEIEAHMRGLEVKITFRKFPKERLIVMNAGYKEKFETELWLVPKDTCPPQPRSEFTIRQVKFEGIYKDGYVPYDCC